MKTKNDRKRIFAAAILTLQVFFMMTAVAFAQGLTGQTTRVSVDSAGIEARTFISVTPSISADGRFVAFVSFADNLMVGDTNGIQDIFVHDRQTRQTTRVSVDSSGNQGNGQCFDPAISADGRFVAFNSIATNLVAGGTNGFGHIFVHDRLTSQTTLVSVDSAGTQGNSNSGFPSISADGRLVAFQSGASNLVAGGTIVGFVHIFVHDRQTGQTTLVSVNSVGTQGDDNSGSPSISADGQFVAFESIAGNLVAGDTNLVRDVFVHELQTGQTTRVSVDSTGLQGINGNSERPSISADGRFVAFASRADNLVAGDTNGEADVFVHDRLTGQTTRVSVDSAGTQGNAGGSSPSISADGRFVAFLSASTNLVAVDTNGFFSDIFVHDRQSGQTTLVSMDSAGIQGNGRSAHPSISADGRFVAFDSDGDNLVPGDINVTVDVFVHNFLKLFSDVQFNNPFYNHVMKVVDAGITLGCGLDTYCPSNPVTRGQMSAFIIRALEGEPQTGPASPTFTDVPLTHVFFRHVERMAALGITLGIGGGLYGPDLNVTRAEMASFIVRAKDGADAPGPCTGVFTDVPIGAPHCANIERLRTLNVTLGCGVNLYCTGQNVPREQMAAFIARAFLGIP